MPTIAILHEDPAFLVLNKPAGMLVHSTAHVHEADTLTAWLVERYPEVRGVGDRPQVRPGIVHRLDRETSGALLVARTQEAFLYYKELFEKKQITKEYRALVSGSFKERTGTITKPIGLVPGTTKRTVHTKRAKLIQAARTSYHVLAQYAYGGKTISYLSVFPQTGRTHQVRVHLNSVHHPVLGDAIYGGKTQRRFARELGIERHLLHAYALTFMPPKCTTPLTVVADLPEDLARVLAKVSDVRAADR